VVAVLAPHAAYAHSGGVAASAHAAAGGGHRRAIVLAPSHHVTFRGAAALAVAAYRTPLGALPVDEAAVAALAATELVRTNPAVFQREHAIEMQLPLLQTVDPGCALVPLLIGKLEPGDAEALAAALRPMLDADTLVVVSSDLVHYGRGFDYLPVPPASAEAVRAGMRRIDEGAIERILVADAEGFARYIEASGATICGHAAIEIMLRALPGVRGEQLAYSSSIDATGDFEDRVVSYAAVAFRTVA